MIVLYIVLAVIVLLLAVVLLRTAAFRPKAEAAKTYAPVEFDREAAVSNLQQLIRCIPMFMKNAPSPACRIAGCCSTGPANPTRKLR